MELPPLAEDPDTRQWLMAMAQAVRRRLLAYPGTADHLLLHGPTGPHSLAVMNQVCTALAGTGRTPRQVAWAYDWLMSTLAADVSKQTQLDRTGGGTEAARALAARSAAYSRHLPLLRQVIGEFTGDFDARFHRVMTAVIDALMNDALTRDRS